MGAVIMSDKNFACKDVKVVKEFVNDRGQRCTEYECGCMVIRARVSRQIEMTWVCDKQVEYCKDCGYQIWPRSDCECG